MCMSSTPSAPPAPPPPQYLHNPFLDGALMSNGANRGRNSLVTFGNGQMPAVDARQLGPASTSRGPPAPSAGTTLPAGTMPIMGQPGTVVPTVGGAMAGLLGGRVTAPVTPPAAMRR